MPRAHRLQFRRVGRGVESTRAICSNGPRLTLSCGRCRRIANREAAAINTASFGSAFGDCRQQVSDDNAHVVKRTRRLLHAVIVFVLQDGERPPIKHALNKLGFNTFKAIVAGRVEELLEVMLHETRRPTFRFRVKCLEMSP